MSQRRGISGGWNKHFGGLGTPQVFELRERLEVNARLDHIVADLMLGPTPPTVRAQKQESAGAPITVVPNIRKIRRVRECHAFAPS
jgi:hypothetical protein